MKKIKHQKRTQPKRIKLAPNISLVEIIEGDILVLNEQNNFKEGDELVVKVVDFCGGITTLRRSGETIERVYRGKDEYNLQTGLFEQKSLGMHIYTKENENYSDLNKQLKMARV